MRWSFPLARFGETQVRVHLTFFLLLAFVAWGYGRHGGQAAAVQGVVFILALFLCVLLHEFGHVLAARAYGIRTPDITLLPIGGVARLQRIPEDPKQELVIALAGPAVNVVIAGALYLGLGGAAHLYDAARLDTPAVSMLGRLVAVNVWLVVFNLIPAFPMDGGRVLRALLAMRMDYARATQTAAAAGQMLAFVFGVVGLFYNPWLILIALFVYVGAGQEAALATMRQAARGLRVADAMVTDFRTLPLTATLDDAVEALLRTSQREFPVADDAGRVVGLLTRDALIVALRQHGPQGGVAGAMRPGPLPTVPMGANLDAVLTQMREAEEPIAAVLVVDVGGAAIGLVTPENLGELMMIRDATRGATPASHGPTPPPLPTAG
jgi:Zn-dependent protease/CBS domain-containing protein